MKNLDGYKIKVLLINLKSSKEFFITQLQDRKLILLSFCENQQADKLILIKVVNSIRNLKFH